MIHVMRFLFRLSAQLLIMPFVGAGLIILSLMFWDETYANWGEDIQSRIWGKNK